MVNARLSLDREHAIILALWLLTFAASSQAFLIVPLLPMIGGKLHVSKEELALLVGVYSLTAAVGALFFGPISDRVGRRRILFSGSLVLAAALALHGLTDSYAALLSGRALAGGAGGLLNSASSAYIGDYFEYRRRGWAQGWVTSAVSFGQVVGIPAGTLVAAKLSFGVPFVALSLVVLVSFVLMGLRLPPVPLAAEGPALSSALRVYSSLLAQRETGVSTLSYFLMFIGVSLYLVFLPTWLKETHGVGEERLASLFLVGGLAGVVTSPLAGRLSDRHGRKPLILGSCGGLALVFLATTLVPFRMWLAYLLFFVAMALVAMRMSPFRALFTAQVPPERLGAFMSLAVTAAQLGQAVGSGLVGPLYTRYGYFLLTLLAALSSVVVALLLAKFVPEPR